MTPHPYRSAIARPSPPRLPVWQRVVVAVAPTWAARRWQWARRALGGRWARLPLLTTNDMPNRYIWYRVGCCPAIFPSDPPRFPMEAEIRWMFTSCWGQARAEHRRCCTCEVWL